MQTTIPNSNFKMTTSGYFGILFLVLIFSAIFMRDLIFATITDMTGGNEIVESQVATQETTNILLSLDKIKLDTSVLNSSYLESLIPFANFPTDAQTLSNFGKINPFLGSFTIVSSKATSSVGALIYSNQRGANNGASTLPVSSTRR